MKDNHRLSDGCEALVHYRHISIVARQVFTKLLKICRMHAF